MMLRMRELEIREEALEQGKRQGEIRGENKAKLQMIESMLADGEDIKKIMKYTQFTKEQIEKIQESMFVL